MKDYQSLTVDRRDGIVVIALNRPQHANSLNMAMAQELADVAAACDGDAAVRAVVLTGSGRFFCAGGDVGEMAGFGDETAARVKRLADELHRAISTFSRMAAPLIVAVNGMAAGAGFSLAATGDLVLVSEDASFTMAYRGVGLSPDGSSSYFLPRLIGLRRTQELMLTDRRLSAQEAVAWGIATRVVPGPQLRDAALELALDLSRAAPQSNAVIKRLLLQTFGNTLETQMEIEGRAIAQCAGSPHGQEGIRAFVEKRRPEFG